MNISSHGFTWQLFEKPFFLSRAHDQDQPWFFMVLHSKWSSLFQGSPFLPWDTGMMIKKSKLRVPVRRFSLKYRITLQQSITHYSKPKPGVEIPLAKIQLTISSDAITGGLHNIHQRRNYLVVITPLASVSCCLWKFQPVKHFLPTICFSLLAQELRRERTKNVLQILQNRHLQNLPVA